MSQGWQPTQIHISTILPQSLILVQLSFKPTPAVPRRKFQASELISSVQAINQFWGGATNQITSHNSFKKKYNLIEVSLALCLLS